MSWALAWFDLPADAGEQDVKRAYVKRLKTTRPDEDPAGFQALREAYDDALAWCRLDPGLRDLLLAPDAETDADDASDDAASDHDVRVGFLPLATLHSAPAPAEDFEDAYAAFLHVARTGTPDQLRAWLEADEALWSLERKQQFGAWLLATLEEREPTIGGPMFDVVLDFFHPERSALDDDAHWHEALRDTLEIAWAIAPENEDQTPRSLRQLTRAFDWRQVLLVSLVPFKPRFTREALQDVATLHRAYAQKIVPEQARWWARSGDIAHASWPRTITALLRCAVIALMAFAWQVLGHHVQGGGWSHVASDGAGSARVFAVCAGAWSAWCFATVCAARITAWREQLSRRWRLVFFGAWIVFLLVRLYLAALR